jgi:RNA polymerase subunit RPABC4/transcription elongation factor Spt4
LTAARRIVLTDIGGARLSDAQVAGRTCPWCSAFASDEATRCPECGAALAQREDIGGLVIPGVTAIDPALQAIDGQPIHLRGPSPSQGMANGVMVAAVMGGPVGLAIVGGIAASAAVEYMSAGRGGSRSQDLEDVGRPSPSTLLALERLEREAAGETEEATTLADPWRDEPRR